ncbi:tetratricopeptide repeat protein [Kovacikia minuta CCNUW1]|nr:tetratricopeptide repeat protein [Kovacikia minuta CCNUW1]
MNLSLCMIVRDEEKALPGCLKSVRDLVSEMIVVDTGSIDHTIEIAKNFGASVYSFSWRDDFSAARNESLKYARGDWILVLDADEVLVPECIPLLQRAIQEPEVLVMTLLRQEVGTPHPDSLVSRVFRNDPQITFSRPYHELIDDSVADILQREPHWRIVELPGVAIHHTGYQTDAIAQRQKVDRARRIMESYLANHPNDSYICSKLGALYVESGNVRQGLDLLQRGLQSPLIEPAVLYELHYHLGSTYSQMQQWAKAEQHYRAATEQPISPRMKLGAYTNWGSLLQARGDRVGARAVYQKTIEADPSFAIGYFNLGLTLKAMGDFSAAIAHYQQAIHLNPTYAEAYQNLGVVLMKVGRISESLEAFRQAIDLHQQQNSPEAERLQQTLQSMGFFVGD